MLIARKPSRRNGETGRIINRMVPSRPNVTSRSPLRNSRPRLEVFWGVLIEDGRDGRQNVKRNW